MSSPWPGSPPGAISPPTTAPPRPRCPPAPRKIYRLSLRGNRRLNHAIHMAAITQISHAHSVGRAYYERKIAAGKTHKEALRCLKRRISDAIYARLRADARAAGLGGQPGNRSVSGRPAHTPGTGSSDKPLPGPNASLRATRNAHAGNATVSV